MDRVSTALKTYFEFSYAVFGVVQLSLLMAVTIFLVVAIWLAAKLYNAGKVLSTAGAKTVTIEDHNFDGVKLTH